MFPNQELTGYETLASMFAGENGSTRSTANGRTKPSSSENKDDKLKMSKEPSWTALPDLILTLFPTGILLASGTNDGRLPRRTHS